MVRLKMMRVQVVIATIDTVLANISLLQHEFLRMKPLIQDEVISIMIDGSVAREDFIDSSSDIDITITSLGKSSDSYLKDKIEETIRNVQSDLPKREYPRKPLMYDIQWQDINVVKETGKRRIHEWNSTNTPKGYPKLWLYAFDCIKYHNVLIGQDITELYTRIPPKYFVPIRLERILKSVEDLGENVSTYEIEKGAITQIKNAWEAIRCICIANDLKSIKKNDIYTFARRLFKDREELSLIEDLKEFYINGKSSKLISGSFRNRLSNFTLNLIKKYT